MKYFKQTLFIALFVLCFVPFSVHAAELNTPVANVDLNKSWTVHFNQPFTPGTINENTVYILNNKQQKVAISYEFSDDNKSLVIKSPATGYIPKQTYTLVITEDVKNGNNLLTTPINKPFTIETIAAGLVITKLTAVTNLYTEPTLTTKAVSYVAAGSSFDYIGAEDTSIAINIAGVTRYIPQQGTSVTKDLSKQSYYQIISNGEFRHYLYNYFEKKFESYIVGKAPSFIEPGVKYKSADGALFKNEAGDVVGESYQYFQYLSVRTPTTYTGEQLDAFIEQELARRNITNSKLVGIGTHLKQIEAEYQINALFLLAFAQHESTFGTSKYALNNNNLFGLKIYDHGAESDTYDTPQDSVKALVTEYLNKNYIPAYAGAYSNGVAVGNKFVGFNVSYASDPHWGAKIAGHMYTIDKTLGSLDHKQYQIGLITETPTNQLNIRPTAANTIAAIYPVLHALGKPLTIVEPVTNTKGEMWYKIISDDLEKTNAHAISDYVRIIEMH